MAQPHREHTDMEDIVKKEKIKYAHQRARREVENLRELRGEVFPRLALAKVLQQTRVPKSAPRKEHAQLPPK